MPSILTSPHFVTHRELNGLIGERTRQRWEKDGLLPEADWVWVDRHRIGIYPGLVLARVVVGKTRDAVEQRSVEKAMEMSRALVISDGYHRFRAMVQAVFAGVRNKEWDFAQFVAELAEQDQTVIEKWHANVAEIEEELSRTASLSFRSVSAIVREATSGSYTVVTNDGEERRIRQAMTALGTGATIVLERVGVESKEQEFVFPGLAVTGDGEFADELQLEDGGDPMTQPHHDPFAHIAARAPVSAEHLLELPQNATMLSVRDEFERGRMPGLLPAEQEAPYVEAEQSFSFAFDSPSLNLNADALV